MTDYDIKSLQEPGSTKTTTGLSDSTHSSGTSSSAERYHLDEFDISPILLYKHYDGPLTTSSQKDLCAFLDKDPSLRLTRKPIPRYASYLDIRQHDLYSPEEKVKYADKPNFDASIAGITMPVGPYLSRIFTGNYKDLYIVKREFGSPMASLRGSVKSL